MRDLSVLHRVRSHIEATGGSDIIGSGSTGTSASPRERPEAAAALGSRLGNVTKPLLAQQQHHTSQLEDPAPAKLTRWQQRKSKPASPPSPSLLLRSIEESEPPPPNRKVIHLTICGVSSLLLLLCRCDFHHHHHHYHLLHHHHHHLHDAGWFAKLSRIWRSERSSGHTPRQLQAN